MKENVLEVLGWILGIFLIAVISNLAGHADERKNMRREAILSFQLW